jgi:hypothetical protein
MAERMFSEAEVRELMRLAWMKGAYPRSHESLDPFLGQAEGFFAPLSLEQLTRAQGVDPAFDLRTLTDAWPEDEDVDAFLAAIDNAR